MKIKLAFPSAKQSQTKCLKLFKLLKSREGWSLNLMCKHLEISGDDSNSRAHPKPGAAEKYNINITEEVSSLVTFHQSLVKSRYFWRNSTTYTMEIL